MKKTYNVIRLEKFKGGLHLARGLTNSYDKSLKTLHSDTIKSALFVCAIQLFGDKVITKESFLEKFKISSAFPFYKSPEIDEPFYFFPKPQILKLPFEIDGEFGLDKKLKKVTYLDKTVFEKLLVSQNKEDFQFEKGNLKGNYIATNRKVGDECETFNEILKNDDCDKIIASSPYQHVAIPRDHGTDSTPYYVDKIYFHQNAGLYFLVEINDKNDTETFNKLQAAVRLLADNGIGTDRNTGNGQFEVIFDTMELEVPNDGNYDLSLSLYCPKREEIQKLDESLYGLTKRGGYISSPRDENNLSIRKRSIHMFTEGSLFPKLEGEGKREGKTVDLRPDYAPVKHEIWRDGQPIFIPMKYSQNGK